LICFWGLKKILQKNLGLDFEQISSNFVFCGFESILKKILAKFPSTQNSFKHFSSHKLRLQKGSKSFKTLRGYKLMKNCAIIHASFCVHLSRKKAAVNWKIGKMSRKVFVFRHNHSSWRFTVSLSFMCDSTSEYSCYMLIFSGRAMMIKRHQRELNNEGFHSLHIRSLFVIFTCRFFLQFIITHDCEFVCTSECS
jgi:hypothetical protein